MDHQEISVITEAVLQELKKTNVPKDQQRSTLIEQIARQVVQRNVGEAAGITRSDSMNSRSSSMISRSSSSLCGEVAGITRSDSMNSRSSSSLSTASGFSTATVSTPQSASAGFSTAVMSTPQGKGNSKIARRNLNFAEEKVFGPKKRRKRMCDPEHKAIVRTVTRPIMEAIDTTLLAPHYSPLFKRFYKRQRVDGKRVLREKYEMDMCMFKDVVRPILRRLLTRLHLPVQDQVDVYSKYYRAAIQIVKKRRANHVQSWRLHGIPKKPVYDVLLPPYQETRLASQDHEDIMREGSQLPERHGGNMDVEPDEDCGDQDQESQQQEGCGDKMEVESEDTYDPLLSVAEGGNYHDQPSLTVVCIDCKCEIPKGYSFPQSDGVWESIKDHRCKKCWTNFMRQDVVQHVENDKERADFSDLVTGKRKAKKTRGEKQKKTRKRTEKCKWCHSTTHKTKRSKKCPFYKQKTTPVDNDVEPTTITPDDVESTTISPDDVVSTAITPDDVVSTAPAPAAAAAVIPPPPVPHRQRYNIGDNVNAKWKPRQFFLAHVTNFHRGLYTVYFVEDGQVKANLRERDLRPYNGPCLLRGEMVDKCFFFPGEDDCPSGIFKIRRLLTFTNTYTCIRMTGGGSKCEGQLEDFDVGYVIRMYGERQQRSRERGEGQILNSKRHR